MRYRIDDGCLKRFFGEKARNMIISARPANIYVWEEAAVEFWAEIERLQAVNAELVSILKDDAIPAIRGLSKFAAGHGVWDVERTAGKIIERAERVIANHHGATE